LSPLFSLFWFFAFLGFSADSVLLAAPYKEHCRFHALIAAIYLLTCRILGARLIDLGRLMDAASLAFDTYKVT
jgi:hypothetical protein